MAFAGAGRSLAEVKHALPGLAVAITGMLLARLLVSGEASFFVGPLVRPLLIVITPVLFGLGAWQVLDTIPRVSHVHQHSEHGHQHSEKGNIMALLVVPLAIVLAGPQPLGLITQPVPVQRRNVAPNSVPNTPNSPDTTAPVAPVQVDPQTGRAIGGYGGSDNNPNEYGSTRNAPIGPEPDSYPTLNGEPAEIGLYDYVQRSNFGRLQSLAGHKMSIVGFASRDPDHPKGPWVIARLKMWCCAADALPFLVTAVDGPPVAYGSWVRVTGEALPGLPSGDAQFKVEKVEKVPTPEDPYIW